MLTTEMRCDVCEKLILSQTQSIRLPKENADICEMCAMHIIAADQKDLIKPLLEQLMSLDHFLGKCK